MHAASKYFGNFAAVSKGFKRTEVLIGAMMIEPSFTVGNPLPKSKGSQFPVSVFAKPALLFQAVLDRDTGQTVAPVEGGLTNIYFPLRAPHAWNPAARNASLDTASHDTPGPEKGQNEEAEILIGYGMVQTGLPQEHPFGGESPGGFYAGQAPVEPGSATADPLGSGGNDPYDAAASQGADAAPDGMPGARVDQEFASAGQVLRNAHPTDVATQRQAPVGSQSPVSGLITSGGAFSRNDGGLRRATETKLPAPSALADASGPASAPDETTETRVSSAVTPSMDAPRPATGDRLPSLPGSTVGGGIADPLRTRAAFASERGAAQNMAKQDLASLPPDAPEAISDLRSNVQPDDKTPFGGDADLRDTAPTQPTNTAYARGPLATLVIAPSLLPDGTHHPLPAAADGDSSDTHPAHLSRDPSATMDSVFARLPAQTVESDTGDPAAIPKIAPSSDPEGGTGADDPAGVRIDGSEIQLRPSIRSDPHISPVPSLAHENALKVAEQLRAPLRMDRFPVEIALDPPELGQVRMTLHISETGTTMVITADRPETAELMRRYAQDLHNAFAKEGHGSLNLQFGPNGQERRTQTPATLPKSQESARSDGALSDDPEHMQPPRLAQAGGGLNLKL
jgi:flagellar hook-length control protein FliK